MDAKENVLTECEAAVQVYAELDEEPFVVIDEENEEKVILELCNAIFAHYLSDEDSDLADNLEETGELSSLIDDNEAYISGKQFLAQFLKKLPKPITVVQEGYHIDQSFRDAYYMYFSNQHFKIKRYSRRISFFKGVYDATKYFDVSEAVSQELKEGFIGCCVINPLVAGAIGRTLINPLYTLSGGEVTAYMRLSDFTVHIYGRTFMVKHTNFLLPENAMRLPVVTGREARTR